MKKTKLFPSLERYRCLVTSQLLFLQSHGSSTLFPQNFRTQMKAEISSRTLTRFGGREVAYIPTRIYDRFVCVGNDTYFKNVEKSYIAEFLHALHELIEHVWDRLRISLSKVWGYDLENKLRNFCNYSYLSLSAKYLRQIVFKKQKYSARHFLSIWFALKHI